MREVRLSNASDIRRALRQLQWHLRRVEHRQRQLDIERRYITYVALRRSQTCDMATQTEQRTNIQPTENPDPTEEVPPNTTEVNLGVSEMVEIENPTSPALSINIDSENSEYDPENPEM